MAQKISREKVALVVFFLLVVVATLALSVYFLASRALNVAANQVDDTLGMMNDYSVLVYPGTIPVAERVESSSETAPEGTASPQAEDSEQQREIRAAQTSAQGIEETLDAQNENLNEPLTVADVFSQYELKGASVLSVSDDDLAQYAVPRIYPIGKRTIGVMVIGQYQTKSRLKETTDNLRAQGADIICALTENRAYVGDPSLVSIVIVTAPDPMLSASGSSVGSTLFVSSPTIGDIGVIAISSSNVFSASYIGGNAA